MSIKNYFKSLTSSVIVALLLLAMFGCSQPATELAFEETWIRHAPPTSQMLAGYGTMINTGSKELTILNISSPQFGSISLHETVEIDGRSSMKSVDILSLKPTESLVLKPGSFHLMLMQPASAPQLGEEIPITFEFDHSYEVTQTFIVSAPP